MSAHLDSHDYKETHTYINTEVECKTSLHSSWHHWGEQCCGVSSISILGTHIHEVAIKIIVWTIIAHFIEIAHCCPHPLHVCHGIHNPATLILIKVAVWEGVTGLCW